MPKSTLGSDGTLSVYNPVTNTTGKVDPSTIPGYYGTFKCETPDLSTNNCSVSTMGMPQDGSFTYEFTPNP